MQEALPQFVNGCKSLLEKSEITPESDSWRQLAALATTLPPAGSFVGQLTSEKLLLLAIFQTEQGTEKRQETLKMVFKSILGSVPDINCIRIVELLPEAELSECLVPYIYDQGPQGAVACYLSAKCKVKLPLQVFPYFLSARTWSKSDLINLSFLVNDADKPNLIAQLETSSDTSAVNRETAEEFRFILFNESSPQPLPPDIFIPVTPQPQPQQEKISPESPPMPSASPGRAEKSDPGIRSDRDFSQPQSSAPSRIGTLKHPPGKKTRPVAAKTAPESSTRNYAMAIGICLLIPIALFFFSSQSDELFSDAPRQDSLDKVPDFWIDAVTQTKITPKFLNADKDYRMGELFLSRRKYAEAISLFEDALSRDPGHLQAMFRLAYCRVNIDDSEGAKASLNKLLKKDSRFQLANLLLARIAAKENKPAEAEKFYQKEFSLSQDLEVGLEFSSFLNQQGKTAQAKTIISTLQKNYPDRTIILPSDDKSPQGEQP